MPKPAHGQTNAPGWLTQPLSLAESMNIGLQHNPAILKARKDIEVAHGIAVETRAIAIPKLQATTDFTALDPNSIEQFPFGAPLDLPDKQWHANIRIVQSIYEGGRMASALRTARLTKEQALLSYQSVIADALLEIEVGYDDVLASADQVSVQEASLRLLTQQLADTRNRVEAGTLPQFNVLRAEVELANARPRLIRARSAFRIAKQNLVNSLGYTVPKEVLEDVPLNLTDKLTAATYQVDLPSAIGQSLQNRTELAVLRKAKDLRSEQIKLAKSGYKPSVQLFAGYGARNSTFINDITRDVYGWNAGALASWNIFDGFATKGRVMQAEALSERTDIELDDASRRIELEVRTAYSSFIEARELLESQKKVGEQAAEALRLAEDRYGAGSGTQLDVLSAQTALTEARSTQIQALHDYSVARARVQRAIGTPISSSK
jgi:outer membrane protein TolC